MRIRGLCLVLLLFVAVVRAGFSQDDEHANLDQQAAGSSKNIPIINVKFVRDSYRVVEVDDPLDLEVQIVNLSSNQIIHLSELTVEPSEAFARTRKRYLPTSSDTVRPRQRPNQKDWLNKEFELKPNASTTVRIGIEPTAEFSEAWAAWKIFSFANISSQSPEWATVRIWLSKLKFVSADQDFVAHVFYRVDAGSIQHETTTRTLRVQSSTAAVVLGAFVGCLLATIFRATYRISQMLALGRNSEALRPETKWFWRWWAACARFACALVTALIALLICQILKEVPNFPIKVTADSVSGGLLLGLISFRLGGWMNDFLSTPAMPARPATTTNPPSNSLAAPVNNGHSGG